MPIEQTIAPGPQLAPIPIPQNTGAPIAQGLSDLGEGLHALDQHRDAAMAASQGASLATMSDQMDVDLAKLQQTSGDAPDYLDQARTIINGYQDRFQSGFGTNMRVRRQFQEASARTFGHADMQQQLWVMDREAKNQANQAQQTADTGINKLVSDPSDQRLDAVISLNNATIGGLHLPEGNKLARQYEGQARLAQVKGMMNAGNYAGASAKLDDGSLDPFVKPEEKEALARQIMVAHNQASEQLRKQIGYDETDLRARAGTPAEWQAIAQRYDAIGVRDKATEARSMAAQIGAADVSRGDTPLERQAKIDALTAMPQRSQDQEQALKGLQQQQALVNGMSTLQRYGYATQMPVAPIDWQNPASIRQRAAIVGAAQERFGGSTDFLLPGEEKPIQQLIASPKREDRIAAAQAVLQAGSYSGAVLDQVAPKDHEFRSAIALAALPQGDQLMDLALRGPDALQKNKAMLEPVKDEAGHKGPSFDDIYYGTDIGRAAALLPPEYRNALYDNTRNLYGAFGDKGAWNSLHPGGVQRSVRFALGGEEKGGRWVGGLGDWQGQTVILPRGMDQGEFDRRVARAGGQDWIKASANPNDPPWTGDRPVHAAELRGLVPVMVRDGTYALRQGNSYITTKSGARFTFDIGKLPGILHPKPQAPAPAPAPDPAQGGYIPVHGG